MPSYRSVPAELVPASAKNALAKSREVKGTNWMIAEGTTHATCRYRERTSKAFSKNQA